MMRAFIFAFSISMGAAFKFEVKDPTVLEALKEAREEEGVSESDRMTKLSSLLQEGLTKGGLKLQVTSREKSFLREVVTHKTFEAASLKDFIARVSKVAHEVKLPESDLAMIQKGLGKMMDEAEFQAMKKKLASVLSGTEDGTALLQQHQAHMKAASAILNAVHVEEDDKTDDEDDE